MSAHKFSDAVQVLLERADQLAEKISDDRGNLTRVDGYLIAANYLETLGVKLEKQKKEEIRAQLELPIGIKQ